MKKILIVSPHPDDVSFSIGASVMKFNSNNILVWDVFSDKNYNITGMDEKDANKLILQEEKEAIERMGISVAFEHLKDAQVRGYKRLSEIFGTNVKHEALIEKEKELFNSVVNAFESLYESWKPDWVGAPVGGGFHVDHLLTREAIIASHKKNRFNLFFYEDLPYSLNKDWLEPALASCNSRLCIKEWKIPIHDSIEKKEELVRIFQSQIRERDVRSILKHSSTLNEKGVYERLWIVR